MTLPAKGVTIVDGNNKYTNVISIHTPAKGVANPLSDDDLTAPFISIHTPAKGVTPISANLRKNA